jgi:transposase
VGSRRECAWILGLPGFRVIDVTTDGDTPDSPLRIEVERRGLRRYACSGCGCRTSRVRDQKERTWHDLPWAAHPVTVVYHQRRVRCRRCGIRTERIEFAEPKARVTRRLHQLIGLDCQSMLTSHAAVRHGVSWGAARRPQRRPRYIGLDEIQRGKGHQFWPCSRISCTAR